MSKKLEIKSGDKYGRLTIVKEVEPYVSPSGKTYRKFNCLCECGNITNVMLNKLRNNSTKSCGCYQKEKATTHGLHKHSLYKTWNNMIHRCYHSNHIHYKYYGGRGIKICDRWLNSFQNFLIDMGERPEGTTLDRKNNDGNYEPSNCRWATPKEQIKNRRKYKKK
jgi:hypothetical protein